jgi:hypothetical protein
MVKVLIKSFGFRVNKGGVILSPTKSLCHSRSFHLLFQNCLERVGHELNSATFVELVLEFYPVKSEGVQEALHCVHAHQHKESKCEENKEAHEHLKG